MSSVVLVDALSAPALVYVGVITAVTALTGGMAVYALRRRHVTGATSLGVLMAGAAIWNGCTALQLLTDVRTLSIALDALAFLGVGVVTAGFFTLGLEYSGRRQLLDGRLAAILAIEPLGIVALAATNGAHGLVWRSVEMAAADLDTLTVAYGPAFWIHAAYSYILLAVGLGLVAQQALRSRSIYRRQAAAVLLGAAVPIVANLYSLTRSPPIDVQPLGFAVTAIAAAWAIARYRLVDLVPIARERVLETLSDPVIVVDAQERITDVNPAARELLAAPEGDLLGRSLSEALATIGSLDALPTTTNEEDTVELRAGDERRHFEVRVTPVTDAADEELGRVLLFHDVTERERSRLELERQNDQLERFASVVSHDLRNPLSVAEGYLSLARGRGDEDDFDAIEESLERMDAIIEDVLTMAREGSQVEDRKPTSLATIARTAWEQVDTGDAALEVGGDATIAADRDRLQRLLENLLRNAVEHGTDGEAPEDPTARARDTEGPEESSTAGDAAPETTAEPTLTVTIGPIAPATSDSLQPAKSYGFFVADDGVGIPPEKHEEVFEPGHSTASEGTGLGLSIVQGIAEAHGWSVSVTDAEGGGARFEITGAPPVEHPAEVGGPVTTAGGTTAGPDDAEGAQR